MEKKFKEQAQRIKRLRKLEETMRKADEKTIRDLEQRKSQEREKFYEYVQKNFVEYVLNLFEKHPNMTEIEFTQHYIDACNVEEWYMRNVEAPQINIETPQRSQRPNPDLTQRIRLHYSYVHRGTNYFFLEYKVDDKEVEIPFLTFYHDYLPQEYLTYARDKTVYSPTLDFFNIPELDLTLGINGAERLFEAVTVNYEPKKTFDSHDWDDDCYVAEEFTCNLDDLLIIKHHLREPGDDFSPFRHTLTVYLI